MCDPSIGRAEVARTRNHSVLLPGFVMTTEFVFGGAREQMMMRHRLGDRTWAALSCHPAPSGGAVPDPVPLPAPAVCRQSVALQDRSEPATQ
jgi:hypothetical protein